LLLHRLGEVLRASAQSFECAALRVDRAIRVASSELAFCLAHGIAGAAELIHLALPLLTLAEALLAQLLHQLLELIAQRLSRAARPSGRPAGLADLVGPAGRAVRAGDRAAGPGPAGMCDRAIAAACGSCRRARRARTSCRRRRRLPSAARDGPSAGSPASVGGPAACGARHPWRRSAPSVRADRSCCADPVPGPTPTSQENLCTMVSRSSVMSFPFDGRFRDSPSQGDNNIRVHVTKRL